MKLFLLKFAHQLQSQVYCKDCRARIPSTIVFTGTELFRNGLLGLGMRHFIFFHSLPAASVTVPDLNRPP